MHFDLLALLENIVSGVVSFFYSLLRSLFETIRRPIRGPLRLYRRFKNRKARQIGGLTFLFLSFFISFYVFQQGDFDEGVVVALHTAVSTLPAFSLADFWPILAGSLVSTIIIDAGLRLWLDLHLRNRRRRREVALGAAEYSLFWTVPFAASLSATWIIISYPGFLRFGYDGPGPGVSSPFSLFGPASELLLPALILSTIPAATIIQAGVRKRRAARGGWARTRRFGARVFAVIALSLLVLLGTHAGMELGVTLSQDAKPYVSVQTLRCDVDKTGAIGVYGLIELNYDGSQVVSPDDFVLQVGRESNRFENDGWAWRDRDPDDYLVLMGHQPEVVHLKVDSSGPVPKNADCALRAFVSPMIFVPISSK